MIVFCIVQPAVRYFDPPHQKQEHSFTFVFFLAPNFCVRHLLSCKYVRNEEMWFDIYIHTLDYLLVCFSSTHSSHES